MDDQKKSAQLRYLEELARCLRREGFQTAQTEGGEMLRVSRDGVHLCRVSGEGTVFYKQEIVDALDAQAELDKVVDIANDTGEYMTMLAYAPPLKAQGLTGDYRVLADFGGAVLAAHPTGQGTKFVTWMWDFDHKGVCYGHYQESEYRAAKRDFASRSGLISGNHLFSDTQLVEIYRCCADTIEGGYEISAAQRDIILGVQEQIECCLPDIGERIREQSITTEQTM